MSAATSLSSGNISSSATVTSPDGISASATDNASVAAPPPPALAVQASAPSLVYVGTTYPLTITPSISSGSATNSPVVTAVLAAGETFPASATTQTGYSCSRSKTTVTDDTLTCTPTASPPLAAGPLGTIVATVDVASGATGTPVASISLADTTDHATPAASSTGPTVVAVPNLTVSAAAQPSSVPVGTTAAVVVRRPWPRPVVRPCRRRP